MFSEQNLQQIVSEITSNYEKEELFYMKPGHQMPSRDCIIHIIMGLRQIMFPGYFEKEHLEQANAEYFVGHNLSRIYNSLCTQIHAALMLQSGAEYCDLEIRQHAEEICSHFFSSLSRIQNLLLKDVEAAFNGDPAAKTKEEIIFCYPGLFAIFVYRMAHELYQQKVPFIPRIMSEYAHDHTGIDINPGAVIGEYFFISHSFCSATLEQKVRTASTAISSSSFSAIWPCAMPTRAVGTSLRTYSATRSSPWTRL